MRILKYEEYVLANETLTEQYEAATKQIIEVALKDYHLVVTTDEVIVLEFEDIIVVVANPVLNNISNMELRNAYIETYNGKSELKLLIPLLCFAIQNNKILKLNEVKYE